MTRPPNAYPRGGAVFASPFPAPMRSPLPELPAVLTKHRDARNIEWTVVERCDTHVTMRSGTLERMMSRERFAEWRR